MKYGIMQELIGRFSKTIAMNPLLIAELAISKKSGARSLKTVFDDCISSALFRIFAGEYTSISLVKPTAQNEKPYVLTKKKINITFIKNILHIIKIYNILNINKYHSPSLNQYWADLHPNKKILYLFINFLYNINTGDKNGKRNSI